MAVGEVGLAVGHVGWTLVRGGLDEVRTDEHGTHPLPPDAQRGTRRLRHRKDKTMPRETDVIYGMTAGHGVTIEVDEAIFGVLTYEQRPGEAYNDVVRRLLGVPPKDSAADEHATGPLPAPGPGPAPGGGTASGAHAGTGTMSEKKAVTVAGVPVTAEAAGSILTVTIGRLTLPPPTGC